MRAMRMFFLAVVAGVSVSCDMFSSKPGGESDLFNGENLAGWSAFLVDPSVKMEDVWHVENGILVCKGEPLGYLYTDRGFTSFRLLVEWRWAPGKEPGNSGVLLRVNGEPRAIPRSIEAQLQSGSAGDLYGFHGMKIDGDPDRKGGQSGHKLLGDFISVSKMKAAENEPGQWNRYDITVDGPKITVLVNDELVNEAYDCEVLEGRIGLQSEGAEIHFRSVRLMPADS